MQSLEQVETTLTGEEADFMQAILLVDDNEANLLALSALLERPGLKLLTAKSGPEALNLLLKHAAALVLLDVQMPGMDGFEVARLMQGRADTRAIPIIFMTAFYRDEAALLRGYRNGAIDYLYKPINPVVLKSKVSLFLELDSQQHRLERAYAQIAEQKRYYQSILHAVGDGVLGVDARGIVRFCNPAAQCLFQAEARDLQGRPVDELFSGEAIQTLSTDGAQALVDAEALGLVEAELLRVGGEPFPVSLRCTPIGGSLDGYVLAFQDISERKCFEEQLVAQATTDPLTGLANRNGLKLAVDMALGRAQRGIGCAALLLIDLDHFKAVNDTYGHDVGDAFLKEVAQRLKSCVRVSDTVARLGGDEFTVVLDELAESNDAAMIAEKILEVLSRPFPLEHGSIATGGSIGIAVYPECGLDAGEMMRSADIAMYRAKADGRNGYHFFTEEMNAKVKVRMLLEQSLRQAVDNQDLFLVFQPIVTLDSQALVGFEVLLRWEHPKAGVVGPETFIPLLEECGLILPVGRWVMGQACAYLNAWLDEGLLPDGFRLSLNVSQRQFAGVHFVEQLQEAMSSCSIPGSLIELELTESLLMKDLELAKERIASLRTQGISVSIDDFGTGYSSLNDLKHLAIDRLKIDQGFVQQIAENSRDLAICRTIVTLAQSLGLTVVAEGVEAEAQAERLRELGCDCAQGFHYARPLAADEAEAYLRGGRAP
ncbi:MAG: EAL domain-containing protein [Gammaproteobacteria bacterium]|nr:EAL domain-containing protein [Gammaproteobacteria bacterium]